MDVAWLEGLFDGCRNMVVEGPERGFFRGQKRLSSGQTVGDTAGCQVTQCNGFDIAFTAGKLAGNEEVW